MILYAYITKDEVLIILKGGLYHENLLCAAT